MDNQARQLYGEIIKTCVNHLEMKDPFLKKHSDRVAAHGLNFSRYLKLSKLECDQIYFASLFHDYGKIFIPLPPLSNIDEIKQENKVIWKKHPYYSQAALENLSFLKGALLAMRQHHEQEDGNGYPDGLNGDKIVLGAKIVSIANQFDHFFYGKSNVPIERPEFVIRKLGSLAKSHYDNGILSNFIKYLAAHLKLNIQPNVKKTVQPKIKKEMPKKQMSSDKQKIVKLAVMDVIKRFKEGKIDLPVLPKVIQDVEVLLSNDSSTVDDLARLVEKDAVVSVRLISVANSPVYRGNEKINTVRQAIPRLGFRETQNLVSAIASRSLYQTDRNELKHLMEKLWEHSYAVGQYSNLLAKHLKQKQLNLFFLFGLVHDIGKVLLIRSMTDVMDENKELTVEDVLPGIQEVHCQFGSALLQRWGFDEDYIEVVKHHDDKQLSPDSSMSILIVHLANLMAKFVLEENTETEDDMIIHSVSSRLLGMSKKEIDDLLSEGREILTYSDYLS